MRETARLWLVPVVAVVLVLALVGALGGFKAGRGAQGRAAQAEKVLELARWRLVVHEAEVVSDPYDAKAPPSLRVHLQATFTGERSIYGLDEHLVAVATPTGALDLEEYPIQHGAREGNFDPDVTQEFTLDFAWRAAPTAVPPVVRVLVRDERQRTNYLFSGPQWSLTASPVAHLDLPCPDHR